MNTATAGFARAATRRWELPDMRDTVARVAPPVPAPVAVAAPEPSITQADLVEARAQGLRDGVAMAEQAAAESASQALHEIATALRAAATEATALVERAAAALADVVIQAIGAAFPRMEVLLGPAEVAAFVGTLLPGLAREPAVLVRIAPASAEGLAVALARLPEPDRARFRIERDDALGPADLRVTWRDGTASRDAAAIRAAVLDALEILSDTTATAGDHS